MNKPFTLIVSLLFTSCLWSQTYEVGGFLGAANAMGDVGSQKQINPSTPVFGLLFKWNKSQRYAWRGQLSYASLSFDDKASNDPSRLQRRLSSENSILELSAGLEVNFIPYNLHRFGPVFSPYLYTGITVVRSDYFYFSQGQVQNTGKQDTTFALPLVFGAKARVGTSTVLGAEIGARYTFTDNLDGSNPINSNFADYGFGDLNNNDWYVFTGISLTFTFTRKPCQDCFK